MSLEDKINLNSDSSSGGGLFSGIEKYIPGGKSTVFVGGIIAYLYSDMFLERLREAGRFYDNVGNDFKPEHGDEIASIILYGDPNRHKRSPPHPYRRLHSLLTKGGIVFSYLDNVPVVGFMMREFFKFVVSSTPNRDRNFYNDNSYA